MGQNSNGIEEARSIAQVQVGDMLSTGVEADPYRRVTRIWSHFTKKNASRICTLSPGCRLTVGHPVWLDGQWKKAEEVQPGAKEAQQLIYNFELEGHVDS